MDRATTGGQEARQRWHSREARARHGRPPQGARLDRARVRQHPVAARVPPRSSPYRPRVAGSSGQARAIPRASQTTFDRADASQKESRERVRQEIISNRERLLRARYRAFLRANSALRTPDGLYMRDFDFVKLACVRRLIEAHASESHVLRDETVSELDEEGYPYPPHYESDEEDEDGWTPALLDELTEASAYVRGRRRAELADVLGVGLAAEGDEAALDGWLDDPAVRFVAWGRTLPAAQLCDDERVDLDGFGTRIELRAGGRADGVLRAIGVQLGDQLYSHHRLEHSRARFYLIEPRHEDSSDAEQCEHRWLRTRTWFELARQLLSHIG